ncbi:MAG: hydrogen gas-evolving membrane-bound hydrogenase subunit E [Actinomycetota bacterium]
MSGILWLLYGAHIVGIAAAAVVGRSGIHKGLLTAAVAPAITAGWAAGRLIGDAEPLEAELVWVEGLDLAIRFRLDEVALMMTLLVSGIGALIFMYATGYFSARAAAGGRFPATLLAFSAAMLGLVWADSIWTLFIFWELTSITSFLLVGHKNTDAAVRDAARRALFITGVGGLTLLAGLVVLGNATGTTNLTELAMVGSPESSTSLTVAAVLIMVGAATKSAQFPFHVWLPGAMAAPTPVSAYLHSATMVKAGVFLVAVTGSAFLNVDTWKVLGLAFGIVSMIWGAVGALRHRDAKLILAWGTVSQLGLLITLLAIGSGKAVFAATSLLFAHALFKATLFCVVGEIDIRTGTRDVTRLSGLYRSMPLAFGFATLAGLSMAGLPPLLGFAAKEAAIEAVLQLSGLEAAVAATAVIGGSVLTVAYTTRFLFVTFGEKADVEPTPVEPRRPAMTTAAGILGVAGVLGFVFLPVVDGIVKPAALEFTEKAEPYHLHRWPGLTTGLMVSFAVVGAGIALGVFLARGSMPRVPRPLGADAADGSIEMILNESPRLISRVQHGSLPVYLATMSLAAIVAGIPFFSAIETDHLVLWDSPFQAAMVATIVVAAVSGAFVGSRLGAALTLGAVGFAVSGLFVLHGAPDLALTQLLVETVIVVGFVVGLGHLSRRFPPVQTTWRAVRILVSVAVASIVMLGLATAASDPVGTPPIEALSEEAVEEGGGNNVVNVILTDIRALDTLGEVVVLAVAAIGIGALRAGRRPRRPTETLGAAS